MILRRVVEHLKQQHWTAAFLDFAIVVVGVFVGLQAQDWNPGGSSVLPTDRRKAGVRRQRAARRANRGNPRNARRGEGKMILARCLGQLKRQHRVACSSSGCFS
jgi:hypothetical protein